MTERCLVVALATKLLGRWRSVEGELRRLGTRRVGAFRWDSADFHKVEKRSVSSGWAVTHQLEHFFFDAFGSSFATTKMPFSAGFAPSRNGLTLMSSTSTEVCAAARHLSILISASAAFGSFLQLRWLTAHADCADTQRKVIARFSEGEGGGGEDPFWF